MPPRRRTACRARPASRTRPPPRRSAVRDALANGGRRHGGDPEGQAQAGIGVLAGARFWAAGRTLTVAVSQHLGTDHRPVLGERGNELRVGGTPLQRDPVADVKAIALARVLHEPHYLAGETLAAQLRSDDDLERDRLTAFRRDGPAGPGGLRDDDVVRAQIHRVA